MEDSLSNQKWFLLGDIHGRVEPIQQFYERNYERLHLDETENFLILLGDVGANFALVGQRDRNFKTELSKYPFTYLCLRGNHEARVSGVMEQNPECWERKKKYDGEVFVEREFPKIEYLSDAPAVYTFGGVRTFSIPGRIVLINGID